MSSVLSLSSIAKIWDVKSCIYSAHFYCGHPQVDYAGVGSVDKKAQYFTVERLSTEAHASANLPQLLESLGHQLAVSVERFGVAFSTHELSTAGATPISSDIPPVDRVVDDPTRLTGRVVVTVGSARSAASAKLRDESGGALREAEDNPMVFLAPDELLVEVSSFYCC